MAEVVDAGRTDYSGPQTLKAQKGMKRMKTFMAPLCLWNQHALLIYISILCVVLVTSSAKNIERPRYWQINRAVLDFDFEKVCSVSLSNINIYGCLVCGKYFQGRGRKSYAYAHAIHDDHHVFINLESSKVGAPLLISIIS